MKNKNYLLLTVLLILLVFIPHTFAQDYTTWHLPEGVIARLGKGVFRNVAYSPDGSRLAVGSSVGVWIYDIESGKVLDLFPMYGVSCMAFSPDGKTLVSGSRQHHLVLWDIAAGEHLRTFINAYHSNVYSVAFSPDGKTLVSGHDNGFICLWEIATGKSSNYYFNIWGEEGTELMPYHIGAIRSITFSPDGKTLVILCKGRDDAVHLWDATTGRYIRCLFVTGGEENSIESTAFRPDGRTVAVGLGFDGIDLWDTKTDKLHQSLNGHHRWGVLSLAFSPEGAMLASGGEDKIVNLWDMETKTHLQSFRGHKGDVFSVAFSPDGKTFASSSKEAVYVWNIHSEKQLHSVIVSNAIGNIAFRPDGQLLTNQKKNNIGLPLDMTIDKTLINRIKQKGSIFSKALSPNRQLLAIGLQSKIPPIGKRRDDTVLLWNTTTGEHIRTLAGHLDIITCVAFSTDGQQLASGSEDETILLWDLKNSKYPRILIGHNDKVLDVAFSPDGKTLASRSEDGIVLLWNLNKPIVNTE